MVSLWQLTRGEEGVDHIGDMHAAMERGEAETKANTFENGEATRRNMVFEPQINAVAATNAKLEATIAEMTKQISTLTETNSNLVKALLAVGGKVSDKNNAEKAGGANKENNNSNKRVSARKRNKTNGLTRASSERRLGNCIE